MLVDYHDYYIYDDSIFRRYIISVYHIVLTLSGNDVTPNGLVSIAFVTFAIFLSALINANIFGNMAKLTVAIYRKTTAFQNQIDIANTAMKNMKLPDDL